MFDPWNLSWWWFLLPMIGLVSWARSGQIFPVPPWPFLASLPHPEHFRMSSVNLQPSRDGSYNSPRLSWQLAICTTQQIIGKPKTRFHVACATYGQTELTQIKYVWPGPSPLLRAAGQNLLPMTGAACVQENAELLRPLPQLKHVCLLPH